MSSFSFKSFQSSMTFRERFEIVRHQKVWQKMISLSKSLDLKKHFQHWELICLCDSLTAKKVSHCHPRLLSSAGEEGPSWSLINLDNLELKNMMCSRIWNKCNTRSVMVWILRVMLKLLGWLLLFLCEKMFQSLFFTLKPPISRKLLCRKNEMMKLKKFRS